MKRRIPKCVLAVTLSALMLAGCVKETPKTEETEKPAWTETSVSPTTEPATTTALATTAAHTTEAYDWQEDVRDLKGMEVRMVNWWQEEEHPPRSALEEDLWDVHENLESKYNFHFETVKIGEWGENYAARISASITAGEPLGQLCVLDPSWFPVFLTSGLCTPLDTLKSLLFTEDAEWKWNEEVLEATSWNGHIYGMAQDHEPRVGVFFNKRLLQEAGYGIENLYDFQKNGDWTWEKFEEVLKACTTDTNGDGIVDRFGVVARTEDFYMAAIHSSGLDFVSKDTSGYYVNETRAESFLNTFNWADAIWHSYVVTPAEGTSEEYCIESFTSGKAAMLVADASVRNELASMDEWGFVVFPRAEGVEYTTFARENVVIIPSSYSTEEADDIAFAYAHWTQRIPAYCDGDGVWMEEGYDSFKDHRAVDETLMIMKRGKNQRNCLDPYVPGLTDCLIHGLFDPAAQGVKTPADALKEKTEEIDRRISDYNAALATLKSK